MVTISDVAAQAGLSTATVSRALNGVPTVDPQLAAKVVKVAQELGYQPHGPARNLRRKTTAVVALIISDVEIPFFTSIARGVEDIAQADGYSVVLCNSDEAASKERRYVDVAIQEHVAGVIISPTGTPDNVAVLNERDIPVVAVDRPLANRTDCVLVDTRQAAYEATTHLANQGYRRIGCVTGPVGMSTADDRLSGYYDGLHAAGHEVNESFTRRAPYRASDAREATFSLFRENQPPDALLVANSAMVIGVLEALSQLGKQLGNDVGVVAFDDIPWATLLENPLSIVAQPAYDIGATAAQLLLARITDNARPASTVTLNAQLVARASSTRGN